MPSICWDSGVHKGTHTKCNSNRLIPTEMHHRLVAFWANQNSHLISTSGTSCGNHLYLGMFAQLANSHHLVAEDALVFWFVSDSSHLQKCPLPSCSSYTHINFCHRMWQWTLGRSPTSTTALSKSESPNLK
jgi:hypothetical protein